MGVVDASRVKEIVERYSKLVMDDRVYFKDDIPEEKLRNAVEKYANIPHDETPLLLIDSAIFGSGKEGAVFTEKRIFGRSPIQEGEIPYNSINSAELIYHKVFVNSEWFFSVIFSSDMNRLRICNMIREIIGAEPQELVIDREELSNLRNVNRRLENENKYLKKRISRLKKADLTPIEELVRFRTEIRETEKKCDELESTSKMQKEEIEIVQSKLRAALEKLEKEESLLEKEIETTHQEAGTLNETHRQTKLQRKTVYDDLTPEERHIYDYVVRQKGTINISQLMRVKRYTADDIFRILDDLESKGLISRIVGELNAGKRFTSRE
jgi:uncharacterized membrane protein